MSLGRNVTTQIKSTSATCSIKRGLRLLNQLRMVCLSLNAEAVDLTTSQGTRLLVGCEVTYANDERLEFAA